MLQFVPTSHKFIISIDNDNKANPVKYFIIAKISATYAGGTMEACLSSMAQKLVEIATL